MQMIMTLVLNESEDKSQQSLSTLLTNLKTEKREDSPIARVLAVKVIRCCADTLKPYLVTEILEIQESIMRN